MNNDKKIVPELRFPEFVNDGEWQYLNGDELFEPISNRDHNSDLPILAISQEHGAIPREMIDYTVIASKESIKSYKVVEKGDFIISLRSFQGGIEYSNYKGICSPAYIILRKKKKLEDIYFKYYFKTELYIRHLNKNLEGIRDGKMVSYKQFSEIPLPYPSNKEQKKIASFLTSLDELIEVHNEKLEALKEHKKGLMQNLFTQEGEKVPKFRFKEFENDGEWFEKSIDTIKSIITDYVANGSFQSLRENLNVVDSEDYAFYVRLTDLRAGLGHSNQRYVDESTYKFLNKSSLLGGELLMANIGANVGEVWQMPFINKPSTLAPNMIMIKFKKDIDSGFVFQYLTSNTGIKSISSAISGSGHPKISKTDLRQVKVSLPPKIKEQQKIASCLSALDNLIKAQSDKIEQLKEYKKGVMQGLFPKKND
jgi:type I restriction enzyme S subunit